MVYVGVVSGDLIGSQSACRRSPNCGSGTGGSSEVTSLMFTFLLSSLSFITPFDLLKLNIVLKFEPGFFTDNEEKEGAPVE